MALWSTTASLYYHHLGIDDDVVPPIIPSD
jgi:hypothetical protein